MPSHRKFVSAFCLAYTAIALFVMPPALANEQLPVEAFAQLPDVSGLTIAPDGKHIAALVRININGDRGTALTIYNVEKAENTTLVASSNEKFVMNWLRWANDHILLISARFPSTRDGVKVTETRLLRANIITQEIKPTLPVTFLRRLNFLPIYQDNVISVLQDDKDHILLSGRFEPEIGTEVLKLNIEKGTTKKFQRRKANVYNWYVDRNDVIRIAEKFKGTTTTYLYRDNPKQSWQELYSYEELSVDEVNILGFGATSNEIYFSRYKDGRKVVYKGDVKQGLESGEIVYENENYDAYGHPIFSKRLNQVVGLDHGFGQEMTFWNEEFQAWQDSINKALPDTVNSIIDMSDDERTLLILSTAPSDPGIYYLWNREKGTLKGVAERYAQLAPELLVRPEYIGYTARDGARIEGVLTLPKNNQKQVPAIIFPHGGPISHDTNGFDYWSQFFANRGYAVLQMNFRGSSGYGFDFMAGGLGDWGGQMQLDIEDGTRWLIDEGIADPNRICIVGGSYGGYAALMEAASDSGLYRCAISFAGVTNIPLLLRSQRRFTNFSVAQKQLGDDSRKLKNNSPVNLTENINIPVLLVHGEKDRVVNVKHSRDMARALERSNKEFEYIELENGTHHLLDEEHRLNLFKHMDVFLHQHIGKE